MLHSTMLERLTLEIAGANREAEAARSLLAKSNSTVAESARYHEALGVQRGIARAIEALDR